MRLKHGDSKLLDECTLPLTGKGCIKKVLTDLAFIEIKEGKFHLLERAPGVSVEEIVKLTAGELSCTRPCTRNDLSSFPATCH